MPIFRRHAGELCDTQHIPPTNRGCHPVCRRPALLWSRPLPGPPRQDGLDARTDAGGSGGGLLGSPRVDGGRDGSPPQPPTDREPPTDPRPSWSRSAPAGGAVAATPPPARQPPTGTACAPLRRADCWPRGPAGCRPTTPTDNGLSSCGGPPGYPPSAPAAGRVAWPESERQRSDGRAPRRRRVRPVQGRLDRRTETLNRSAGSRAGFTQGSPPPVVNQEVAGVQFLLESERIDRCGLPGHDLRDLRRQPHLMVADVVRKPFGPDEATPVRHLR